jgi:hypothetical protein
MMLFFLGNLFYFYSVLCVKSYIFWVCVMDKKNGYLLAFNWAIILLLSPCNRRYMSNTSSSSA